MALYSPTRRGLLTGLSAAGLLTAAGALRPRRAAASDDGPRYLIVLGCFGGASMLDCFLPVDGADALTVEGRGTVIHHSTTTPKGSNIRCVDRDGPVDFLSRYAHQSLVMGAQASSVNHFTAQARAINGRNTLDGRTLGEALAAVYGQSMPLPNVNMGRGGFAEPGTDPSLDPRYRAEIVTNPLTFPLSTSGWEGLLSTDGSLAAQDPELLEAMIAQARAVRDGTLEQVSPFAQTFASSQLRQDLLYNRATTAADIELNNLIHKLLFVPDLGDAFPLDEYGLTASEESALIQDTLPEAFPTDTSGTPQDRLQAQAALAYLLIKSGSSCAVTLTDPGTDGFLAFDQSHTSHADAQSTHWDRAPRGPGCRRSSG